MIVAQGRVQIKPIPREMTDKEKRPVITTHYLYAPIFQTLKHQIRLQLPGSTYGIKYGEQICEILCFCCV
jgi:hypothetical protein